MVTLSARRSTAARMRHTACSLVSLNQLDDPEPILLGDEPIYRDGELAGVVTSGEYGHTIGTAIGLGYVESEDGVTPAYIRSGKYEIEIATERYTARVRMTAPYDPKSLRVHM